MEKFFNALGYISSIITIISAVVTSLNLFQIKQLKRRLADNAKCEHIIAQLEQEIESLKDISKKELLVLNNGINKYNKKHLQKDTIAAITDNVERLIKYNRNLCKECIKEIEFIKSNSENISVDFLNSVEYVIKVYKENVKYEL